VYSLKAWLGLANSFLFSYNYNFIIAIEILIESAHISNEKYNFVCNELIGSFKFIVSKLAQLGQRS
jgi:hypothetical protein